MYKNYALNFVSWKKYIKEKKGEKKKTKKNKNTDNFAIVSRITSRNYREIRSIYLASFFIERIKTLGASIELKGRWKLTEFKSKQPLISQVYS